MRRSWRSIAGVTFCFLVALIGPRPAELEATVSVHDQQCPDAHKDWNAMRRRGEQIPIAIYGLNSYVVTPGDPNFGCYAHAGNTKVMVISMREGSPPTNGKAPWWIEFGYRWDTGQHGWSAFYSTNTISTSACAPNCPGDGPGICCLRNRGDRYVATLVAIPPNSGHWFCMGQDPGDLESVNLRLDGQQLTRLPLPTISHSQLYWSWATMAQYENHYTDQVQWPPGATINTWFYLHRGGTNPTKGTRTEGYCDAPYGAAKLGQWWWEATGPASYFCGL